MVYRQRTRAQTQFGDYLDLMLVERKHSVRSFGRLVKVTSASITTFKRTRPPKKRILAWADALRLTGPARQRFIELAWLTHTPAFISERYMVLQTEVERLKAKTVRTRCKSART